MLSENIPFLAMEKPCDEALEQLVQKIGQVGLTSVRTFDLQVARQAQSACPCPHHGTDECDCQMVVLLVYDVQSTPLTLVAHGYNGQTWFSVVDNPQQRADQQLEDTLRKLALTLAPAT